MPPPSSTAPATIASRSPRRSTCAPSRVRSTARMRRHPRRRGSSRSASSSASRRSASISATATTPTAASPSACCGRVTRPGSSPVSAGCSAGCSVPGADNQQIAFQGQGRRPRPVKGLAGRHLPGDRPVDKPADRRARRLLRAARDGGHRHGEPRREVPGGLPSEQDQDAFIKDACTRMTDAFLAPLQLHHHADPDLQHHLATELDRGQPPGCVQHRRHPRQRRLGHPAQQRQGRAAHQRTAADPPPDIPRNG